MASTSEHGGLLVLNAGSSSLRLSAFSPGRAAVASVESHMSPAPAADGRVLLDFIESHALSRPGLIAHRVVHGGDSLRSASLLTTGVRDEIRRLQSMAPLHNRLALEWIEAADEAFGRAVRQVACFDTAYFADLPEHAARYALPDRIVRDYGIRRYGFHGLAHQSMIEQWRARSGSDSMQRVISLQLGSGCSVTASANGQPLETSMGFSPLEGLVMATRCGNLDPAAVLHLVERAGMSSADLDDVLNRQSGLLGVSGESADLRVLLESPAAEARLAVDMFCHRIRQYIGACLAVLHGAEAVVFGGGIGENSAIIRHRALQGFEWAGVRLDQKLNDSVPRGQPAPIHARDSGLEVWVIPPNEAAVMAAQAGALLQTDQARY